MSPDQHREIMTTFSRNPTPANAVRLAIADHKALHNDDTARIDWGYVCALLDAVKLLEPSC